MAFPEAPSRRIAWDADGTVAVGRRTFATATAAAEPSAGTRIELNDEDEVNVTGSSFGIPSTGIDDEGFLAWLFPELREVDGFFGRLITGSNPPVFTGGSIPASVQGSGDTTNGTDGTWSTLIGTYSPGNQNVINNGEYRAAITSLAAANRRGIRVWMRRTGTSAITARAFHWYGEISAGETPDRLLWFDDVTGLKFTKPLDYGDVPRGSASDHTVFLKNNSAGLTAGSVQVTAEDLFLGSGAWYTFSEGGSFQATLALASSIGAGANSPDITIRRIVPDNATLGLHAGRAYANVGSWT